MSNIQLFKEKTFGQMRGYADNSGKVWLNFGDVVRGLGFVHPSGGIRKNILKTLLKRFGYSPKVTVEDYIPENIFYRLAMKADSPNAESFQGWLADDVIPQIRQTGSYSVAPSLPAPSIRQKNIANHKAFTSVLQLFISYAQSQGDTRDPNKIFAKFTSLANRVAGIQKGCRPVSDDEKQIHCTIVENLMSEIFLRGMNDSRHFAAIESEVILKLRNFAGYLTPSLPLLESRYE